MCIRHSGGNTDLGKNDTRFGMKLVEDTEGSLWFWLEKSLFQLENDIFLCGAYIPSHNTTPIITVKTAYFGKLKKTLIKY